MHSFRSGLLITNLELQRIGPTNTSVMLGYTAHSFGLFYPSCQIYIRRLGPHGGRGRRSLGNLHKEREKEERSERGMDRNRESRVVVVRGTKTSEEVSGLQLYSTYELSITAFNSKGESPPSSPHSFSTPEGGESTETE